MCPLLRLNQFKMLVNLVTLQIRVQFLGLLALAGSPRTPGDQSPAHNFTCQCYAASQRKNQSAVCQSLTEYIHYFVFLAFRDIIY